jgi:hypothetical protein
MPDFRQALPIAHCPLPIDFAYFTHLTEFFSIFVIRYGKKEESSG